MRLARLRRLGPRVPAFIPCPSPWMLLADLTADPFRSEDPRSRAFVAQHMCECKVRTCGAPWHLSLAAHGRNTASGYQHRRYRGRHAKACAYGVLLDGSGDGMVSGWKALVEETCQSIVFARLRLLPRWRYERVVPASCSSAAPAPVCARRAATWSLTASASYK